MFGSAIYLVSTIPPQGYLGRSISYVVPGGGREIDSTPRLGTYCYLRFPMLGIISRRKRVIGNTLPIAEHGIRLGSDRQGRELHVAWTI